MAILRRLLSVGGESASFLLPTFSLFPGSNHELVQEIDRNDNIVALEPIQIPLKLECIVERQLEVSVGGPAIWAFRDQHEHVHIGNATELRTVGRRLLSQDLLRQCPMAAAEMVTFCAAETEFPHVLSAAFAHLKSISKVSAEAWRDTVILLPTIKQDLEENIERTVRKGSARGRVFAFAERHRLHIHLPRPIAERVEELPKCQAVAKIFGIREFVVHSLGPRPKKTSESASTWSVYGVGGIARHVIGRPPFAAYSNALALKSSDPDALATGNSFAQGVREGRRDHLIIGIVPSNIEHAHLVNDFIANIAKRDSQRHAFNIRPAGFGTPRKDKPSPSQIRQILSEFDFIWIIANHRKHQSESQFNSLIASNSISRLIKTASFSIIECLDTAAGRYLLDKTRRSRGFGLVGATRYVSAKMDNVIRLILYSMLCEDAYLHSASRIFILWPFPVKRERRTIVLGRHQYKVEILDRSHSPSKMAVGYAIDVGLSERTEEDFRDFCVSLLAGYGWKLQREERRHLIMRNKDETIRISPVISPYAVNSLLAYEADENFEIDLIISNQSIPPQARSEAKAKGWVFIHYSELSQIMSSRHDFTL